MPVLYTIVNLPALLHYLWVPFLPGDLNDHLGLDWSRRSFSWKLRFDTNVDLFCLGFVMNNEVECLPRRSSLGLPLYAFPSLSWLRVHLDYLCSNFLIYKFEISA